MARWTSARRQAALERGDALPPLHEGGEPRFPIADCEDVHRAVRDLDRIPEAERPAVRRHIARRALELGCKLPDSWRIRHG